MQNFSDPRRIASLIDHTLLKPEATASDIRRLCAEAKEFAFYTVCVNPYWVRLAVEELTGSSVGIASVIGFPLGANEIRIKIAEANFAIADGARELDMVQNVGALRSEDFVPVREEIAALADLAHASGATLKVILETCLLSNEEKITSCRIAQEAGADFVKTSTGFSTAGATVEDVSLMRRTVGNTMGIKASGGIRSLAVFEQMVAAGASRIGTSSGVSIIREMLSVARQGSPVISGTASY